MEKNGIEIRMDNIDKKLDEILKNQLEFSFRVKKIEDVEKENNRIKSQNEELQEVKDFLIKIGVEIRQWRIKDAVERKLKELENIYPNGFKKNIDILIDNLKKIYSTVEKIS